MDMGDEEVDYEPEKINEEVRSLIIAVTLHRRSVFRLTYYRSPNAKSPTMMLNL
jgi:hypothetical protein